MGGDCRGIVLLGLEAPTEELEKGFRAVAGKPHVKGFAVGRTIFNHAAQQWLAGKMSDADLRVMLILRLLRFFKLARYSPGMRSLAAAMHAERNALLASGVLLFGAMLLSSSLIHLAEIGRAHV
mgnify:CR=1 FL=1